MTTLYEMSNALKDTYMPSLIKQMNEELDIEKMMKQARKRRMETANRLLELGINSYQELEELHKPFHQHEVEDEADMGGITL